MMNGFNKFKAKPTEFDGVVYRSQQEARTAKKLVARQASGDIAHWERQRELKFVVNGIQVARYIIDFVPVRADGTIELLETKGMMLPEWKIKWRLLEAFVNDPKWRKLNGFFIDDRIELVLDAGPRVTRWARGERKKPVRKKRKK